MNGNITIRNLTAQDIPAIKSMINEEWEWSSLVGTQEVLDAVLGLYLNQVLFESTFAKIAEAENEVVGVIFGCLDDAPPLFKTFLDNATEHALVLLGAPENERKDIHEVMTGLNTTYKQLLHDKEGNYDGTLDFFIVSEKAQGLGIGKLLWNELKKYFAQNKARAVYVYTDTDCNFGFYEHAGFTRADTRRLSCNFTEFEWAVDVFLYEYIFS